MKRLYEAYVGPRNSTYYMKQFNSISQLGGSAAVSWNWWAFLFGGVWALYRKMYGWFFFWLFVFFVIDLVGKSGASDLAAFLMLSAMVSFGLSANYLYFRYASSAYLTATRTIRDSQKQIEYLRRKGGVHIWVPFISAALFSIGIVAAILLPIFKDHPAIANELAKSFLLLLGCAIWLLGLAFVFGRMTQKEVRGSQPMPTDTLVDRDSVTPNVPSPSTNPQITVKENRVYELIAEELESGRTDKGLWTRLFAECEGDEKKTKVLYIKERAARLIYDEQARSQKEAYERSAEAERAERLRPSPTGAEQMKKFGITFDGERYTYKEYRYAKLDDAIAYAKVNERRLKA